MRLPFIDGDLLYRAVENWDTTDKYESTVIIDARSSF
jgi:hypothetical protein